MHELLCPEECLELGGFQHLCTHLEHCGLHTRVGACVGQHRFAPLLEGDDALELRHGVRGIEDALGHLLARGEREGDALAGEGFGQARGLAREEDIPEFHALVQHAQRCALHLRQVECPALRVHECLEFLEHPLERDFVRIVVPAHVGDVLLLGERPQVGRHQSRRIEVPHHLFGVHGHVECEAEGDLLRELEEFPHE